MKRNRNGQILAFATVMAMLAPATPTSWAAGAMASSASATSTLNLKAVPFNAIEIDDDFWQPRRETNRKVSIPHSLEMLEKAGNLKNLELAASGARSGFQGPLYIDSDLYKAVEAVCYSLSTTPDAALEARLDKIIEMIEKAQMPDGYLNTHFQVKDPSKRWANLRDAHELYCAGHLFEAAVAHYRATGKKSLLNVATRFADLIDDTFGDAPGKRKGYPGHEEIELALIKLWQVTGEERYFDLAKFFIMHRGEKFFAREHNTPLDKYDGEYWQDNVPVTEHRKIVGHAVRAVYLMAGVTDLVARTSDPVLTRMLHRVWDNTVGCNMYVTGGIGSSAANEGFTFDYDLPNLTAYQETCASVAMVLWSHRMNLLHGDARYADVMERALYNGMLAGVSLDGTRFFYVNPLASKGKHHRSEWYSCACCPPNVTRTLAQLGGFVAASSPGTYWLNLYIQGSVTAEIDGDPVTLSVQTEYPWDGQIHIKPVVESAKTFQLRLRIPSWARDAEVTVNGEPAEPTIERGYAILDRTWAPGDKLQLNLPMPVEQVAADPRVTQNIGRRALQRGPLVYCLEDVDHTTSVSGMAVPTSAQFETRWQSDLLGGIVDLTTTGYVTTATLDDAAQLYYVVPESQPVSVTAIPYYAWDNRKAGGMEVWLPVEPVPTARTLEQTANLTLSFTSYNCQPEGIRDGLEPKSSAEKPPANCHFWPHKGQTEWAEYAWDESKKISASRVYWFDDTGRGECRIPASWRIEYHDGSQWKPVAVTQPYKIDKDKWCEIEFDEVETDRVRLVLDMQPDFAAGILEWQIEEYQ